MSDFLINYKRSLIKLGIIVLVALIIRLAASPLLPPHLLPDNLTYQGAALDILKGEVISSHNIMPLYPLFLALFGAGEKTPLLIGIIAGLISVIFTWALARAIFEDEKAGLVAAGLMTAYPMAIFYSVAGLTESLFIPLVLGAFLALHKNRPALASTLLVLSILARPAMDAFAPFVIFWHTLVVRKAGLPRAFLDLAIYGILYALIMSPWWYHNAQKYDYFMRLTHGFGLTLYAGNNPMNTSGGGIGKIDYDIANVFGDQFADSSDVEVDRILRDTAIEYIRNNPGNFFKMAGVKFVRLWSLMPYTPLVKGNKLALITTLSLLPVLVFAFITLITRRDLFWHLTPILGLIAYLTLVHIITIGSIRYRYPLEPLLIVIATPSLLLAWNFVFSKEASAKKSNTRLPDTQ